MTWLHGVPEGSPFYYQPGFHIPEILFLLIMKKTTLDKFSHHFRTKLKIVRFICENFYMYIILSIEMSIVINEVENAVDIQIETASSRRSIVYVIPLSLILCWQYL